MFGVSGLGSRVWNSGFRVQGFTLRVVGPGLGVQDLGLGLGVKNLCNYSGVH